MISNGFFSISIFSNVDGVAVFVDKYLDVIFTPQGDVKIDDRDALKGLQDCDLIKTSEIMNRLELQKW